MIRRFALSLACLVAVVHPALAAIQPDVTADKIDFIAQKQESVFTGHVRITFGPTELLADEIRYNYATQVATATGHVVITRGAQRLVAERGTYSPATGAVSLVHLRLGEYPAYVTGDTILGDRKELVLTNATLTFDEPNPVSPVVHARRLVYYPGERILAESAWIGAGPAIPIYLPKLEQKLNEPILSQFTTTAGYRHNVGGFLVGNLNVPVAPGVKLGASTGFYSARGVMVGPTGNYAGGSGDEWFSGDFRSGYINDHGDKGTDILGHAVPEDRDFFQWRHQQSVNENLTVTGMLNYWSDSEVLRDFRPKEFFANEQPDSFLEAVYSGRNYFVSAFSRFQANTFAPVQQRLPEVRFDLLPTPIGGGVYERFHASAAVLDENFPDATTPTLHSTRFDSFYQLSRPINPSDWLNITPVAGGRLTYYDRATGGKDNYTRALGEVGVDAELRASGVYEYKNERWQIDGLRHLLTPKISYRYVPEADRGRVFIPAIDRPVFATSLQPIELGDIRNTDAIPELHTLRFGVDNTIQTRDPAYGSRDLFFLNLAEDLRYARQPGDGDLSDVYAELGVMPARWLRFDLDQRLSPQTMHLRELNTGLTLLDGDARSLRFATRYLEHQLEEYYADYRMRFNEAYDGIVRLRYDARQRRFAEQTYSLRQNLHNTWSIQYEVSVFSGSRRERGVGFNLVINSIGF